jgi:hypothetical protein
LKGVEQSVRNNPSLLVGFGSQVTNKICQPVPNMNQKKLVVLDGFKPQTCEL